MAYHSWKMLHSRWPFAVKLEMSLLFSIFGMKNCPFHLNSVGKRTHPNSDDIFLTSSGIATSYRFRVKLFKNSDVFRFFTEFICNGQFFIPIFLTKMKWLKWCSHRIIGFQPRQRCSIFKYSRGMFWFARWWCLEGFCQNLRSNCESINICD